MGRKPVTFSRELPPVPVADKADFAAGVLCIRRTMAFLDCSRSTVLRLIDSGELVVSYVGGDPRISRASAEEYLRRQREKRAG